MQVSLEDRPKSGSLELPPYLGELVFLPIQYLVLGVLDKISFSEMGWKSHLHWSTPAN